MNLDRTFCSGLRCNRTDTCDRSVKRAEEFLAEKQDGTLRLLSVAQFADHAGVCGHYQPHDSKPVSDVFQSKTV